MAKLITIERGKRSRRSVKSGQGTNTAMPNQESEAQKAKLPYAVSAVVAALLCLYVAVTHIHSFSGEKELTLAQAQNQAHHKYNRSKS